MQGNLIFSPETVLQKSENAESNDENLLVIDSPAMAEAYVAYFETLYAAYGGTV
jgi:hypothetical protein